MNAPTWFILTRLVQNPIGSGPSGQIGGFRDNLDNFGRLIRQHPEPAILIATFLVVVLWLVQKSGSN